MSIYSSWPLIGETEDGDRDGTVLLYRGSHRFPSPTDPTSIVELATIPAWCVPGCDDESADTVAAYLRLSVSLSDAVLTEASATELRDQLTEWIARPKEVPRA